VAIAAQHLPPAQAEQVVNDAEMRLGSGLTARCQRSPG
jgi:hypothetical protein